MPAQARCHQLKDEIVYHVMNRGNGKFQIFHEEEDYLHFKDILKKYTVLEGLIVYHYCIMPNHYHLEAELENPEEISSIMGGINRAYTHYYHKKYNTCGYLWQGRFKSKAVEKEEYAVCCGGYIEMNPVRSKIIENPEEYKHSSAKYYLLGEKDEIVTEDRGYHNFGNTAKERRKNYLEYLRENAQSEYEQGLTGEVVGNKDFRNKLCRRKGRWVPRRRGKPGISL